MARGAAAAGRERTRSAPLVPLWRKSVPRRIERVARRVDSRPATRFNSPRRNAKRTPAPAGSATSASASSRTSSERSTSTRSAFSGSQSILPVLALWRLSRGRHRLADAATIIQDGRRPAKRGRPRSRRRRAAGPWPGRGPAAARDADMGRRWPAAGGPRDRRARRKRLGSAGQRVARRGPWPGRGTSVVVSRRRRGHDVGILWRRVVRDGRSRAYAVAATPRRRSGGKL